MDAEAFEGALHPFKLDNDTFRPFRQMIMDIMLGKFPGETGEIKEHFMNARRTLLKLQEIGRPGSEPFVITVLGSQRSGVLSLVDAILRVSTPKIREEADANYTQDFLAKHTNFSGLAEMLSSDAKEIYVNGQDHEGGQALSTSLVSLPLGLDAAKNCVLLQRMSIHYSSNFRLKVKYGSSVDVFYVMSMVGKEQSAGKIQGLIAPGNDFVLAEHLNRLAGKTIEFGAPGKSFIDDQLWLISMLRKIFVEGLPTFDPSQRITKGLDEASLISEIEIGIPSVLLMPGVRLDVLALTDSLLGSMNTVYMNHLVNANAILIACPKDGLQSDGITRRIFTEVVAKRYYRNDGTCPPKIGFFNMNDHLKDWEQMLDLDETDFDHETPGLINDILLRCENLNKESEYDELSANRCTEISSQLRQMIERNFRDIYPHAYLNALETMAGGSHNTERCLSALKRTNMNSLFEFFTDVAMETVGEPIEDILFRLQKFSGKPASLNMPTLPLPSAPTVSLQLSQISSNTDSLIPNDGNFVEDSLVPMAIDIMLEVHRRDGDLLVKHGFLSVDMSGRSLQYIREGLALMPDPGAFASRLETLFNMSPDGKADHMELLRRLIDLEYMPTKSAFIREFCAQLTTDYREFLHRSKAIHGRTVGGREDDIDSDITDTYLREFDEWQIYFVRSLKPPLIKSMEDACQSVHVNFERLTSPNPPISFDDVQSLGTRLRRAKSLFSTYVNDVKNNLSPTIVANLINADEIAASVPIGAQGFALDVMSPNLMLNVHSVSELSRLLRNAPVIPKPIRIDSLIASVLKIDASSQKAFDQSLSMWPLLLEIAYMNNPDDFTKDFSFRLIDFFPILGSEDGYRNRSLLSTAFETTSHHVPLLQAASEFFQCGFEVYEVRQRRTYRIVPRVRRTRTVVLYRIEFDLDSMMWSAALARSVAPAVGLSRQAESQIAALSSSGALDDVEGLREDRDIESGYRKGSGSGPRALSSIHDVDAGASAKYLELSDEESGEGAYGATISETRHYQGRRSGGQKVAFKMKKLWEALSPSVPFEKSHLMVAQGRRTIYVLSFGEIDGADCFFDRKPSPSYRLAASESAMVESEANLVVIPNHWKVAVAVYDELCIIETNYRNSESGIEPVTRTLYYGASRLNSDGVHVRGPEWSDTSTGALRLAFKGDDGVSEEHFLRLNGRALVGIGFEHPQLVLRDIVVERINTGKYDSAPDLKRRVAEWLASRRSTSGHYLSALQDSLQPADETRHSTSVPHADDVDEPTTKLGNTYLKALFGEYASEMSRSLTNNVVDLLAKSVPISPVVLPDAWTMRRVTCLSSSKKRLALGWMRPVEVFAMFLMVDEHFLKERRADGDAGILLQPLATLALTLKILALDDTCKSELEFLQKNYPDGPLPGTSSYKAKAFSKYRFESILRVLTEIETCIAKCVEGKLDLRAQVRQANPEIPWPADGEVPRLQVSELRKLPISARAAWFVARQVDEYQLYAVFRPLLSYPDILRRLITRLPSRSQVSALFPSDKLPLREDILSLINSSSAKLPVEDSAAADTSGMSTSAVIKSAGPLRKRQALDDTWEIATGQRLRSSQLLAPRYMGGAAMSSCEVVILGTSSMEPFHSHATTTLNWMGFATHYVPSSLSRKEVDGIIAASAETLKVAILCAPPGFRSLALPAITVQTLETIHMRATQCVFLILVPAQSSAMDKEHTRTYFTALLRERKVIIEDTVASTNSEELEVLLVEKLSEWMRICGQAPPIPVTTSDAQMCGVIDVLSSPFSDDTRVELLKALYKEQRGSQIVLLIGPMGGGRTTLLTAAYNLKVGKDLNIAAIYVFEPPLISPRASENGNDSNDQGGDYAVLVECFRMLGIQLSASIRGIRPFLAQSVSANQAHVKPPGSNITPAEALDMYILKPCFSLSETRKFIRRTTIVLDAVDRLGTSALEFLGHALAAGKLPSWICFILSARSLTDLKDVFKGARTVWVDTGAPGHRSDIMYCLEDCGWKMEQINSLDLVDRSEGLYRYCIELSKRYPSAESKAGLTADGFPSDILEKVWETEASQYVARVPHNISYTTIQVLSAVRDPLPERLWLDFLRHSLPEDTEEIEIIRGKSELSHALFVDQQGLVHAPHASFLTWFSRKVETLQPKSSSSAPLATNVHKRLAELLEGVVKGSARPTHRVWRFAAANAMFHYLTTGCYKEAAQFVLNPMWFWSYLQANGELRSLDRCIDDLMTLHRMIVGLNRREITACHRSVTDLVIALPLLTSIMKEHDSAFNSDVTVLQTILQEAVADANKPSFHNSVLTHLANNESVQDQGEEEVSSSTKAPPRKSTSAKSTTGKKRPAAPPAKRGRPPRADTSSFVTAALPSSHITSSVHTQSALPTPAPLKLTQHVPLTFRPEQIPQEQIPQSAFENLYLNAALSPNIPFTSPNIPYTVMPSPDGFQSFAQPTGSAGGLQFGSRLMLLLEAAERRSPAPGSSAQPSGSQ